MTKNKKMELGRRLVACKGFRWMRGMSDVDGCTIVGVGPLGVIRYARPVLGAEVTDGTRPGFTWELDLGDPATLGCLLSLVREVWCDCRAYVDPHQPGIMRVLSWQDGYWTNLGEGATEAEALVCALEAAP